MEQQLTDTEGPVAAGVGNVGRTRDRLLNGALSGDAAKQVRKPDLLRVVDLLIAKHQEPESAKGAQNDFCGIFGEPCKVDAADFGA
jgi:hypothetical protein